VRNRGRDATGSPLSGIITLVNNSLRKLTKIIHCSDRYVIIEVVNVYLPCVGSANRQLICDEILTDVGRCTGYATP